ncbi:MULTISPECIES: hypothetical protein [unclassified Phycicoccus]|nr:MULTISPECIES: hypothetical protein [unclassified Phycicoccus]
MTGPGGGAVSSPVGALFDARDEDGNVVVWQDIRYTPGVARQPRRL